jgi:hypothetical protein
MHELRSFSYRVVGLVDGHRRLPVVGLCPARLKLAKRTPYLGSEYRRGARKVGEPAPEPGVRLGWILSGSLERRSCGVERGRVGARRSLPEISALDQAASCIELLMTGW